METLKGRPTRDGLSGLYYVVRIAIFLALTYGIDRTPFKPERLIGLFHLGGFGSFILAFVVLLILWSCSGFVIGLFFILGVFTVAGLFPKSADSNSSKT